MSDGDKLVWLTFENPKVSTADELHLLACRDCNNKTFTARFRDAEFPEMYCAACGGMIGHFGWAE